MAVKTLIVACALFLGIGIVANGKSVEVTYAYCKTVWLFAVPCDKVNMAIVTQIKAMSSYQLGPVSSVLIQANHTSSPGQVENVNFTMKTISMGRGCYAQASSVSTVWYSLLDNGTNYCNLYNVLQGSGLNKAPGFTEFTNDWLCLGYGLSPCK